MNAQSFPRRAELEAAQERFAAQLDLVQSLRAGMRVHFRQTDSRALYDAGMLEANPSCLPRLTEAAMERLEMRLDQRLTFIGEILKDSVERSGRNLDRALLPIKIERGRHLSPLAP